MGIPVIDFSKLDGEARAVTLAHIADCCENWGFFQLVNHGIPEELLERVKKVCSECYKVEREEGFKDSDPVQLLNKLQLEEEPGLLEGKKRLDSVDWEDVFTLLDDNEWPSRPAEFKETMKEFRAEVKKLGERVMDVMDENLGLEKGYTKRAFSGGVAGDDDEAAVNENPPFYGTKVSHYPPCPRPDLVPGLRAHTDAGGVILLFQDDKFGGLQVLKDGLWIDVQPLANAIVINTGDQVEVLSNGRYKSAWHRVLATADGNRRSIASFYNPSLRATIAPAAHLVKEECGEPAAAAPGAAAYPSFVFGDYMDVYAKQKFLPKEPRFQAMAAM